MRDITHQMDERYGHHPVGRRDYEQARSRYIYSSDVPRVIPQPITFWPIPIGGGTTRVIVSQGNAQENAERDRASGAACIGAIFTLCLAPLLAYVAKQYKEDKRVLKDAQETQALITNANWGDGEGIDPALKNEFVALHKENIDILKGKAARTRNYVLLTAGLLACAVTGFVGGMFAMQGLITASIIAGVALAAIGLFVIVYNWGNPELSALSKQRLADLMKHFEENQNQPGQVYPDAPRYVLVPDDLKSGEPSSNPPPPINPNFQDTRT
ncbi:MAG: hypothetical protein KGJ02_06690 [Verrucomicrobiota bacterium]|nr:hypothetical protein [Verrucomicrobiota bacterium]